ncbi:FbpB family small basic protein [Salipaludibacillus aurantiacus]|uniref:Fur-regulated basic protein B n=1 Tax=Salipaludibacillus aurantiacus TaxID=1601833 RepID=A0A1H9SKK1_9BACI|nr:FbpB family small basic protein [Salipaludibacillus aurantiacus]SER84873.1 Fur-regulated basic protein B [Salipaludibacillus aurantiacus]
MRKRFHKSFEELVKENKQEIMQDQKAIIQIEKKIDEKYNSRDLQKA